MRKSITSQIGILIAAAAIGIDGFHPTGSEKNPFKANKLALTKRQLKVRAANKLAKKARKINRN